jgi:NhaP-type Na+/H+ or K+/H+ antiporter
VAACTPVLIATGSSMDWKQVTVLAFGGLRGVLTLTLALIVSETEVQYTLDTSVTAHNKNTRTTIAVTAHIKNTHTTTSVAAHIKRN